MRIVVFGIGKFYQEKQDELIGQEIIAFLDNNSKAWGTQVNGITVYNPLDVLEMSYDAIVLMSIYSYEMRRQLLDLGVDREKIFYFKRFCAYIHKEEICIYGFEENVKGEIAIIASDMNYDGASLAVIQISELYRKQNLDVTIVCPKISTEFLEEMTLKGNKFIVCPRLRYAEYQELEFLANYKKIIANTFCMIQVSINISKYREVIMWVHEPEAYLINIKKEFEHIKELDFPNIRIYAVSKLCRNVIKKFYPTAKVNILPLGIKDTMSQKIEKGITDKIVFAIIGSIGKQKSQDIFLQAIRKLSKEQKEKAEFWIIGLEPDSEYVQKVRAMAAGESSVKFLGQKKRNEMEELFSKIDVIVCASIEETLSIAIVEGMMYQKVCVTTNTTGIAEYIESGKNGFVCETQNVEQLSERILWIIDHILELDDMRKRARETYIDNFSLSAMEKALQNILL